MASRGVNKVILVGNLGNDPEIRVFGSGDQVANFSLATSEIWQDKNTGERKERTEWHRCVAYRKLAEIIGQYVRKGSKLYVEGRLQTRQWQDKDGQTRYVTEILVNDMQMLDSRSGGTQDYAPTIQSPGATMQTEPGGAPPFSPAVQPSIPPVTPSYPSEPSGGFGPDPDAGFDDDVIPF